MQWLNQSEFPPQASVAFAEQDLKYCQALSRALLTHKQSRAFPDLVALGYWLRRSNLTRLLAPYRQGDVIHRPLGTVYHSTPSNVDSLFAYSGVISLLCGNANIIRLSSRSGGSTDILVDVICTLAKDFPLQNARIQLLRCDREATELSKLIAGIDARVLWGSDNAIQMQRKLPIPAHARELAFGHKFSLCVLDSIALLAASDSDLAELAQNFIKDQLTFAQQGCSSAKTLVWLGNTASIKRAQQRLWLQLDVSVNKKKWFKESHFYDAFANAQQLLLLDDCIKGYRQHDWCCRLLASRLTDIQAKEHCGNGLFIEIALTELSQLTPMLKHYHQTLSYWGVDHVKLQSWLAEQIIGIDRIVPIGQALAFDLLWDGMDLIAMLSRQSRALRSQIN
ncbi:acyl-CoA reductase [Shewanella psychropiezotolerans]|uniref:long-chain-fatty-acyl-CoA reductase n=1 Tax=Shewanella psychropiezotolerans TaxID=2593655 RepID=A0ABX5WWG4_9GAMM|nr:MULTISPECIES: acyl-CoA reductase [Shewanella]MPY24944.1 acyl-CoA reductase [Shewanella sp. YLB-07]QDO83424.1 acyl-CoA reductase [Shewanella psychropiezotolerans]